MDWILSTLASSAADELAHRRSLKDDINRLQTTLPKVRILIDKAECWSWKHKELADLLMQLKDASYDADDLLDDFDYQELQHKIECTGQSQASQLLSSSLNSARNIITRAPNNVRDLQGRLDHLAAQMETVIRLLHLDDESKLYGMSAVRRETSSFLPETEVFGRDEEREVVVKLLLKSRDGLSSKRRKLGNVSVFPLVGMGGVGKTTLAQLVYNDQRLKDHFDLKMWVCVTSDCFDVTRITREMIEKQYDTRNLNFLQMVLKEKVMSRRFLLVLDDVWNEESEEWKRLVAPLRSGLQGSMILVTTRSQKVADITGTMEPMFLNGLQEDAYWECFKTSAFCFENPEDYPELEAIGKKIAAKLNGSPLAAKTLGGLLNYDMDATHWRTIMNSEMWELPQKENDILPALRLSYQYLPAHLKRCFSICSIFPKDHVFLKDVLINLWLAQGYILPQGNMILEDIGASYFDDLVSRSFLQQFDCFSGENVEYVEYVMHDLVHDLSQSVSQSECFSIQNGNFQQENITSSAIRHLAVRTRTLELSKLMAIGNFNKLQSLLLLSFSEPDLNPAINLWFNRLTNIRYLKLSQCKIKELPESIGYLKHLRYLDICGTSIERLPEALCCLYNLLFLNLSGCPVTCFPIGFSNLINLRSLILTDPWVFGKTAKIGKLTSLQTLPIFQVLKQRGHMIEELMDMKQLHGSLWVINLENVESKEDARQAKLNNKEYLHALILQWSSSKDSSSKCSKSDGDDVEGVLEGLQPHPNLRHLEIRGYRGARLPFWAQMQMLPCLTHLTLLDCQRLIEIASLTSLSSLSIINCPDVEVHFLPVSEIKLTNVRSIALALPKLWDGSQSPTDEDSAKLTTSVEEWVMMPHRLHPTIKVICIKECKQLVFLPVERFKDFIFLKKLKIIDCPRLITWPREMVLPTSVTTLVLDSCGDLDKSLPNCLRKLTALTHLTIRRCPHIASLPLQVTALEYLAIEECEHLNSLEGIQVLPSLRELDIQKCPKLMPDGQVQGRFVGLPLLSELTIDNTAIVKLPFLISPPPLLERLTVCDSLEDVMFTGEGHEWLQSLNSLVSLRFECCFNLQLLPAELHSLTSLKSLEIFSCPEIQSLPEKGLPTSLIGLYFHSCHPVLTEQLENHKALLKPQI